MPTDIPPETMAALPDDPPEIWLEPACAGDERCWCSAELEGCCEDDCGMPAVRYIRDDRFAAAIAERDALLSETAALRAIIARCCHALPNGAYCAPEPAP